MHVIVRRWGAGSYQIIANFGKQPPLCPRKVIGRTTNFRPSPLPHSIFQRRLLSQSIYLGAKMAVSETTGQDNQVQTLRKILTSEQEPLARRFRALFSLKYVASLNPPTEHTVPAIEAIAAAFTSPSALLKHELAYCLGQSRNDAAVSPLRQVLEDKAEDTMCRHEAAEALGALGDKGSLPLLKELRDSAQEPAEVRETCQIAVDRIEWEHSQQKQEKLKQR
ncbi:unnamed protein product [Periconia digitata]|uniref:Deoxyhypusine monooxygenase n=1 Tax=Periconia digitata TaxID=1303443 RepID=A0A9W4XQE5_9PLEO|nr:unnamed protein product [Periconia digitata]